jgi:predicted acetylornithine/succinylornithine family transaminase
MKKNTKEIIETYQRYIVPTYKRLPVVIEKGKGCKVWDIEGREYLDFVAGIAVNTLGHAPQVICEAINSQVKQLIHVSNLYYTLPQVKLAKILSEVSFNGKVFFANSGAEANEAAIKFARKFGKATGGRYEIITMKNSFHGRTIATLTATGQNKIKDGFEPLLPGFKHVEFNNISAVEAAINNNTCGIFIEPIQGEGGVNVADGEFLQQLRVLCDKYNILLILDEVQTGIARTGKMFAYQHYGITPDIITLAKGLGGGVPIGAMIVNKDKADIFSPGTHATTFGATPLICAVSIAVIEYIIANNICLHVTKIGEYFVDKLRTLADKYSIIQDIRGKGLMIGMELKISGMEIIDKCIKKGLLINCTTENVLRFLPPLIITKQEVDNAINILDEVISECLKKT